MKEIGGYIELGGLINKPYHTDCLSFNSFRSALIYYIRNKNINKIYLPIYLCDVVYNALIKEKCEIVFYNIGEGFLPLLKQIENNAYLYIVNYYGLLSNETLENLQKKYERIIVDNTHAFFRKPLKNVCTIYGCRKYFGVPDGAYMISELTNNSELSEYITNDKMLHIIGRLEENASKYYEIFSKNDEKFIDSGICLMSKVTKSLMGAMDYELISKKRLENYNYLLTKLSKYQKLKLPKDLDFMYPLYIENGEEIRKYLISKKIYIPKLWPNIVDRKLLTNTELNYINNILPIPIDHRYSIEDMDIIINYLEEKINRSDKNEKI